MEEPVQTFSIGFSDPDFDETVFAEKQSEYAGTNHRSQIVNPSTLDVLPKLARHFGEPFADSSAIPTYYLSNFAAEEVKVALSGDGGDECFGGYNRYRAMKFLQSLRFLSRSTLASELISWITDLLPTPEQRLGTSRVAVRLLQLLPFDPVQQYLRISGLFSPEEARSIIKNKHHSVPDDLVSHLFEERMEEGPFPSESGGAANVDLHLYLPGDLLTKVDITSMAHSLEVRSPFLDPNILSFSARLPMSENLTMFQSKMFLKQAMTNDLHPDIRNRSKQGFGVPIGSWLRKKEGEDWLRELTRASSGTAKYFNHEQIVRMVREHRNGAKNHRDRLWLLLMFELWHREFMV